MHILLYLTPAKRLIDIGSRGNRDLLAPKRKRDRLDDGGPGVDAEEDIASHGPRFPLATRAAELMPPPARAIKPPMCRRRTRADPTRRRKIAPVRRPWPGSAHAKQRP